MTEEFKLTPKVTSSMANSVSQYRREMLEKQTQSGLFREPGSTGSSYNELKSTAAGYVVGTHGKINKTASQGWSGSGGTVRQAPEIYSPLWLNSNLNMPRDRATINSWSRAYYATNPMVHNAISLHSTYPISKLSIKCKHPKIEKFFSEQIEELDLMNICCQIAQEYWTLGEAFPYAQLDDRAAKWSQIIIQNPDYIVVNQSVAAMDPLISLRPDENLKRIVSGNKASDIQQRQKLDKNIVDHVKKNENIPLDNLNISHLARKISPYETRGTGLTVTIFKQLMLWDQLRECKYAQAANMINPLTLVKVGGGSGDYKPTPADLESWRDVFECYDEETEVLTDQGFKKFYEIMNYHENNNKIEYSVSKPGINIACFNSENEQLEYHAPLKTSLYNYSGDMYHFANDKIDINVTPNHDMWTSELEYEYNGHRSLRKTKWGTWKKIKAKDLDLKNYRFRSKINWKGNDNVKFVNIMGKQVPIELYLEFLGYLLSEGCLYKNKNNNCHNVIICQSLKKYYPEMKECIDKFGEILELKVRHAYSKQNRKTEMWSGSFNNEELYNFFKEEIGNDLGQTKSYFKKIPKWVLELSPRLLNILLKALVMGDGSIYSRKNKNITGYSYYSTSKQLSDDVFEIVYKLGHVPTAFVRNNKNYMSRDRVRAPLYTTMWSIGGNGEFPKFRKNYKSRTNKKQLLTIENYQGKVWCLTVPTGLFITRRNGKITIQGNSAQYDKDFKIITHEAVTVERIGANSGILDTSNDFTQLMKEIYIGLMVPPVLMDGGADTSYANGGVALDVLRQRYMQFRNKLSAWLRRKIFAPIAMMNEFYDYEEHEKVLIVPEIDWNHMSLFDAGDYIATLLQLSDPQSKRVSVQSLYRSLGLDWEDESRKIKVEIIQEAIVEKEKQALSQMNLNELRALGPNDEIVEPAFSPLPGEETQAASEEDNSQLPGVAMPGPGVPGPSPGPVAGS